MARIAIRKRNNAAIQAVYIALWREEPSKKYRKSGKKNDKNN